MQKSSLSRAVFLAGSSFSTLILAAPVMAQESDDGQDAAQMAPNAIIVTANRRAEAINDVGLAIQAFSGEQLSNLKVNSTEDLQAVVPSLNISRGYQGIPIYTLRGIGFNTINLSATSTVGTYQDEVALAYPFMNSGPVFDLERVEVLKGPQGTLYGRNTTGGLVNFITAKPRLGEFGGSLAIEGGTEQTLNTEGHLNLPAGESVAIRAAWRTERSWDGWQKSITRDETQGEVERYGGRLSIAAEPIPDMRIELTGSFWINKSDTLAAQAVGFTPNTDPANLLAENPFPLFNAAGLVDYVNANGGNWSSSTADWQPLDARAQNIGRGTGIDQPNAEDSNFYSFRGMLQFDFAPDISFISLTGFNHAKRDATYDWSGAPYEILSQRAEGDIDSLSQEIRFQGKTGPAEWVVGGYYANDKVTDTNQTLLGDNANVGAVRALMLLPQDELGGFSIFDLFNTFGYTVYDVLTSFRTYRDTADFDVETWSVFASADWELSPELTLTTGIRYTKDTQDYFGCSRDFNGSMLPNVNLFNRAFFLAAYGALVDPISENQCNTFDVDTLTFGDVTSTLKEDNVAWRGALTWEPNDDTLVYASVSRGYKSGSTPVSAANIATQNRPAKSSLRPTKSAPSCRLPNVA